MASDRRTRRIERLLDEAEEAVSSLDWETVRDRAQAVLAFVPDNSDALDLLTGAARALGSSALPPSTAPPTSSPQPTTASTSDQPTSFANGRYQVKQLLGEGGKKKVYLAHDTLLDGDVAFALIKTEGMNAAGRSRISRVAQAMGITEGYSRLRPTE